MGVRDFEKLGGRTVFDGRIISVTVDRFRFADGEEVEREIVHHPGAVAIVAYDADAVYLVRQPRQAANDPDSLEIPAGMLDVAGEPPEQTARRELAEEIGKAADTWEHLKTYYSAIGSLDEVVHLYLATGLTDRQADSGENERIEVVAWPLGDIDGALAEVRDSKTLLGLLYLRDRL